MDDPNLLAILIEDLLSFGDLGFGGHSNARYTPPKWAKNQWRCIMSNSWNRDGEPPASEEATITFDDFVKMLKSFLDPIGEDHRLAFLKRYVIAGLGCLSGDLERL